MRESDGVENDDADSGYAMNSPRRSFFTRKDSPDRGAKVSLGLRVREAMLKPATPSSKPSEQTPQTVEEIQATIKSANDKERLIGLIAAPIGAAIGSLVTSVLIANDPPARLSNGTVNKLHVSVSLYHEVLIALLVLSAVMLAMALLRKRLYLGIVMALYGLTVFNLHYWGFGIPFIMVGAWYLVRAYRFQRSLREATGEVPPRFGTRPTTSRSTGVSRPRASKRYTPPGSARR